MNEKLKGSAKFLKEFISQTLQETDALKRYKYIDVNYQWILATQN